MENIYDNGAIMLGNIQRVIMEIEKEIENNVDMFDVDIEQLLKELKELRNIDYDMIVAIDYELNYSINYWISRDIIKNS